MSTLSQLVSSKILSKFMPEKIAASGLCYQHLKLSFERNGYDGIESLFKELIDGKPRVTRCKKIISAVFQHFLTFQREVTFKTLNILFKFFFFKFHHHNFFGMLNLYYTCID